jgi:L-threonylcarbamoyladenylate synthase
VTGQAPEVTTDVARAVEALAAGLLVAVPTETVYGLAADAANAAAVRRIFEVKGRPSGHPVIVHLAGPLDLDAWADPVPPAASVLAQAFWPGPLTLVTRRAKGVLDVITGGRETVGLRAPDHPMTREVLRRLGKGVAAPSANRFGRVSPTTPEHVVADLGADVDVILDGGPCRIGVESTILDCTADPPMILRPGGVGAAELEAALGKPVARVASGPSRASGMLASHYAPRGRVEIVTTAEEARIRYETLGAQGLRVAVLDPDDDVARYAQHLYGWLREADDAGADVIVAVAPSDTAGLGAAVLDRLRKAAAPRPNGGEVTAPPLG